MNAPLIFLAIDVAAIVCALLLGARVLSGAPRRRSAWLVALIALCSVASVVLSHQEYGYWMPPALRIDVGPWAAALNLARNLTAGLLMVLCHALFTDRKRFPPWLLVLLAVQLGLEEPGRSLVPATWRYARLVSQTAPSLLQTLFVAFALYWTLADWRADLVESRRRTRALTLVIIGVVTIASVLLTRVLIDPNSRANYLAHVALTAGYLAILTALLFQFMDGGLGRHLDIGGEGRVTAARAAAVDTETGPALARLTTLLEDEQICQQPGLSLKALAGRVGLPEYRLRRLIHEQLGYRNFNALLHDYRIKEACRQLRDPQLRRTPILTIALSVGYESANTFNRGFLEIMRLTPSAYRARERADGAGQTTPEPK